MTGMPAYLTNAAYTYHYFPCHAVFVLAMERHLLKKCTWPNSNQKVNGLKLEVNRDSACVSCSDAASARIKVTKNLCKKLC